MSMRIGFACLWVVCIGAALWLGLTRMAPQSHAGAAERSVAAANGAPERAGDELRQSSRTATLDERVLGAASATTAVLSRATTRIRTLDAVGSRVAGVDVHATQGDGYARLGTTDARGELEIERPSGPWGAFAARAPGRAAARVAWNDEAPAEVELRFAAAGSIRGRVALPGGAAPPLGCHVLAVPAARTQASLGRGLESLLSDPELRVAATDAAGEFELDDLELGQLHELHAGGGGCVLAGVPVRARPGDPPVVLEVGRAFAAQVEFQLRGGAPACVPEVYGKQGSVKMAIADSGARFVFGWPASAGLALGPTARPSRGAAQQTLLLVTPHDVAQLGPIELDCEFPGHAPLSAECFALPVDGVVPVWNVALDTVASEFSRLRVDLAPHGAGLVRSHGRVGPVALLGLTNADGQYSQRVIRAGDGTPLELDCVPHGEYEVEFVSQPTTAIGTLPLGRVSVGAHGADLALPAARFGELEITARTPDGRVHDGELEIAIGSVAEGVSLDAPALLHGAKVQFLHAPYLFALLPRGRYRVWISGPDALSTAIDVEVAAGEPTRVELQLTR